MSARPYISTILRKLRLLSFADRLRFGLQKIKYRKYNREFIKEHPLVSLPPAFFIYETYKLRFDEYFEDGKATANEIISMMESKYDLLQKDLKILDWGCGPGRIIRHLPSLLPASAEVYGADYNRSYMDWCRKNLKGIHFIDAGIDPPLDHPGSFFDIIIGMSVFTHLSSKNHPAWINELHRVTKPKGLVFLTTQGRAYLEKMTASEQRRFGRGELVAREFNREGNRLFSVFQPEQFMKDLVKGKFEIIDYIPAPPRSTAVQDSWLLRKT